MTPKQLAAIEKAGQSLQTYLIERAQAYLLRSARQGLSLCASALDHDGYVNTASGETAETASGEPAAESFSGALTKAHLEETLMPAQLYRHNL